MRLQAHLLLDIYSSYYVNLCTRTICPNSEPFSILTPQQFLGDPCNSELLSTDASCRSNHEAMVVDTKGIQAFCSYPYEIVLWKQEISIEHIIR
mmetsp:Transcript_44985/g.67721  ORF Transcript_44985/g.67721 Transcript_44985/m.67721 type:complete len:94 (-) Transcript_44985:2452-2733(-)